MTMIAGVLMVRPAANRDGSALGTKPIATIVGDVSTDATAFDERNENAQSNDIGSTDPAEYRMRRPPA
jgi:hypothetical protein